MPIYQGFLSHEIFPDPDESQISNNNIDPIVLMTFFNQLQTTKKIDLHLGFVEHIHGKLSSFPNKVVQTHGQNHKR